MNNCRLKFKDIILENQEFVIGDLSRLNEVTGIQANGILGYANIFPKYVTKIDFTNSRLMIYQNICDVDISQYKKIPFELSPDLNVPEFDISFHIDRAPYEFSGKVLFDTGANLTLLINSPFNKAYPQLEKSEYRIHSKSQGLVNSFIKRDIIVSHIQIGDFHFNQIPISISHCNTGVSSNEKYMGILGAQLISRFDIIIDYKNKNLYLKPNLDYFNDFEILISGIQLINQRGKIIVFYVDENSEAYNSGIREGDEVEFINNIKCKDINFYRKILNTEGKEISIGIKNSFNQSKIYNLTIKRFK
jgi:hypothetical protein